MAARKISIYRDGVWSGDGTIDDDYCIACSAVLGATQDDSDDCYEAIADAIEDESQDEDRYTGSGSIERPDGVYSWTIDREVEKYVHQEPR